MTFATKTIRILKADGTIHQFSVEIADTTEKLQRGLGLRKNMAENKGMLFLFDKEMQVNMWMKDTYIPLDMLFIKSDGKISKIVTDTQPLSLEIISSEEKINTVLELNAGVCKKLGITINDRIDLS